MLNHSRTRALAVALATAALAAAAGAAPSASAGVLSYCGVLTPPKTACSQAADSNGTYFYDNQAYYGGSGTVSVCEKVYLYATGSMISRRCADTLVGTGGDLSSWAGWRMAAFVGNNSDYNHTINGYAYYP